MWTTAERPVPGVGIEPTWDFSRGILSPLRLPFRHPGQVIDSQPLTLHSQPPKTLAGRVCGASLVLYMPVVIGLLVAPSRALLRGAWSRHPGTGRLFRELAQSRR